MIDVEAARTFVHSYARQIDRRRFEHFVASAPAEPVLIALVAYRNPDGGFGALEPDLRTPASQPIPVRYAFDVLAEVQPLAAVYSMAHSSVDWLARVSNDDGGVPFVLPSAAEQPAAPWMVPAPESSLLATAQLAAGALRLGVRHPWVDGALEYCWSRIDGVVPADAYTFKYVVDLLDVTPDRDRADLELDRLATLVPADGRIAVPGGAGGNIWTRSPSPRSPGTPAAGSSRPR